MSKLCFFLLFLLGVLNTKISYAMKFGEHFYGHAFGYVGFGLGYQGGRIPANKSISKGLMMQVERLYALEEWQYVDEYTKEMWGNSAESYVENYLADAEREYAEQFDDIDSIFTKILLIDFKFLMPIGVGYNVYWKTFKKFHLFLGADLSHTFNIYGIQDTAIGDAKNELINPNVKEIITMYFRFGAKYAKSNLFSFQFYGLIGFTYNDAHVKFRNVFNMKNYNDRILGFATGCGMEFIFSEKWIVGLEYRLLNTKTNKIHFEKLDDFIAKLDIDNHYILFKFGYQFL